MAAPLPQVDLKQRCRELGMSHALLARRSGVSLSTVNRVLDDYHTATFESVEKIARALGLDVSLRPLLDVDQMCRQQARQKAERLVAMVQGTSGLEGQAVDDEAQKLMVTQTMYELLAGSRRKLWA